MNDVPENLFSSNGDLERPFQSSGWLVPSVVHLDPRGRFISWKANLQCTTPREPGMVLERPLFPERTSSGGKGMLEQFLALEKAPIEQIAKFVARWGPLQIRRVLLKKGYPRSWVGFNMKFRKPENAKLAQEYIAVPLWSYVDDRQTAIQGKDAVYAWRHWSRKFRCAARAWNLLQNGKASLECEEWRTNWSVLTRETNIWGWQCFTGPAAPRNDLAFGTRLAHVLKDWMNLAGISLEVQFSDEHAWIIGRAQNISGVMHFEIRTNNVLGGLVLQLVAAISGVSGYAICSMCGEIYSPTRQPRVGMRNYCRACQPRADVIKAQRYRDRKRNKNKQQKQLTGRAKGGQQRGKTRQR
jgi:hypothetical protein